MTDQPGRIAVITGGSSGLGLAMARRLAGEGHTLVLLARHPDRLDEAVASVHRLSPATIGIPCDVTRHEELVSAAETIRARFSRIHFLILNAGVVHVNCLEDVASVEMLKADLETDLWGVILSAYVLIPLLAAGGRVLCISSGFGLVGVAGYAVYGAAKAGVINFAAALRRELLCRNIRVYAACPPDIDTPQYRQEVASMPAWMPAAGARGRPMPADRAAEKILRKCTGDRFLIVIDFEVRLLLWANRLLPLRWVNLLIDRLFPRPAE
jgi:3-dehydrosphinganine reductase